MELQDTIEHAYEIFGRYARGGDIDACPCCVGRSDQDKLAGVKLRDQPGDLLSRFAFKAMTTWGGVDDFKHFLPRIFELMTASDRDGILGCEYLPGFDLCLVASKLEYAQWRTWPEAEKIAVRQFMETLSKTFESLGADGKHLAVDLEGARKIWGVGSFD